MIYYTVYVFAFLLILSIFSTAQGKNNTKEEIEAQVFKQIKKLFKIIDKNKNEKIEKSELIYQIIRVIKDIHNRTTFEVFYEIDTDKDNKVSLNEYSLFEFKDSAAVVNVLINVDNSEKMSYIRKKFLHKKKCFYAADTDGDGLLNIDEYLTFNYPVFFAHMVDTLVSDYMDQLDTNFDGFIDKEENLYIFKNAKSLIGDGKANAVGQIENFFLKYDNDKNEGIDYTEYYESLIPGYDRQAQAEAENLLKQTDTDKDGTLSLEEFEKNAYSWLEAYWLDDEVSEDASHDAREL